MQQVIQESGVESNGSEDEENIGPPPPKRRKIGTISKVASMSADEKLLRKELKMILLKNPKIKLDEQLQMDDYINSLDISEIKVHLENAKIEIGLKSPINTAEELIGMVGIFLQRYYNNTTLHHRLINDTTLIAAVEQWVPLANDYLSVPLQIFHRVVGHVTDVHFNQSNFSASTERIPRSDEIND